MSLSVLELGCGTGLFGNLARRWSRQSTGIDLSSAMVQRATERGIYDCLETAEITARVENKPEEVYDVIALCDSLIYFGDLRQVVTKALPHLIPGGLLGFTVERSEHYPFQLTDSGRFAHHVDHLLEVVSDAGMQVVSQNSHVLRFEYGEPVGGWTMVLRRPFQTESMRLEDGISFPNSSPMGEHGIKSACRRDHLLPFIATSCQDQD